MDPFVGIILINYNSIEHTEECVKSLRSMDYDNFAIIVVDNCSRDAQSLKEHEYLSRTCDIVLSDKNEGFAAGNNIGIAYAQEKYNPEFYWILNNDTVVEPSCLRKMIEACKNSADKVGLVTNRINYYSQRDKSDYRGGYFDWELGVAGYYDVTVPVRDNISFASGCSWLIPCQTLQDVGYMDESFFMYCEDVDYCCRILLNNYKILYCDQGVIYHKISASNGAGSPFNQYYIIRNSMHIIRRYAKKKWRGYVNYTKNIAREILSQQKSIRVAVKAYRAFIKNEMGRNEEY